MEKNKIFATFIKEQRKKHNLTQKDLALKSGLGLRFIRDLEQGKPTIRLDKLNVALAMFGCEAGIKDGQCNV